MQGKRSQEAVYNEFVETFEDHHQLFTGVSTSKYGSVSLEEFNSYYTNVSSFYDSDEQFAILMSNAWSVAGQGQYPLVANKESYYSQKFQSSP